MSDKYAFIAAESATPAEDGLPPAPSVTAMCAWLGVSKSGFYEWLGRPPSPTQRRRDDLAAKIKALFDEFGGTYGYRRIHAELLRRGEQVGIELVRALAQARSEYSAAQAVSYDDGARRAGAGDPGPAAARLHRRAAGDKAGR